MFGAEQEPPCLNGALEGCNNTWTAWSAGVATPGAYIVRPNFTFQPYMVSKTDVTKKPFSLDELPVASPRERRGEVRQSPRGAVAPHRRALRDRGR